MPRHVLEPTEPAAYHVATEPMTMDYALRSITIAQFRQAMLTAAQSVHVVTPEALREPLHLWFIATAHRAGVENWENLLNRPVVAVWNAAQAVLEAAGAS